MTARLRHLRQLIRGGAGLSDEIAAGYRGVVLLGDASSIKRLADLSDELTLRVYLAQVHYELYLVTGNNLSRALALDLTEELMAAAQLALKGNDLKAVEQTLTGWWRFLTEGVDEVTRAATARRLDEIARSRGAAFFARRAARMGDLDFGRIYAAIDRALTNILNAKELSKEQLAVKSALKQFLKIVPRSDAKAWEEIVKKLVSYPWVKKPTGLRARIAVDPAHFRKAFRNEANGVKGFLQETWFWRSKAWKSREGRLLRGAQRRAERLGLAREEWEPLLIAEPLLTIGGGKIRGGKELYDGAIIIARRFESGERTVEGFLDVAVQIKAEKDISAFKQGAKDLRREVELGGLTELRTRDGATAIRLLQAPDANDPIRVFVLPQLPEAYKFRDLPPGVSPVLIPSMADAQQLDYLAYFLIRTVVEAP